MKVSIVIKQPSGKVSRLNLESGKYYQIGRATDADILIEDTCTTVSRNHAQLYYDGKNVELKHLSATNPTLVNDREILNVFYLTDGDIIELSLGGPKLKLEIGANSKGRVTVPKEDRAKTISQQSPNQENSRSQQPQEPPIQSVSSHPDKNKVEPSMPPKNWMVESILVTLFCGCLPLGIVAVVNANKVNTAFMAKDFEGAELYSKNAKKWMIISLIAGPIFLVLMYFLVFLGLVAGVSG